MNNINTNITNYSLVIINNTMYNYACANNSGFFDNKFK